MRRARALAAVVGVATLLAACTPADPGADGPAAEQPAGETARTAVEVVGAPAPTADLTAWAVPATWADVVAVDPGWDHRPLESDGLLLGFAGPGDEPGDGSDGSDRSDGGPLEFSAVDSTGEVRWRTERPPACSGYTLSRAGDRPVAVLTDVEDGGLGTTASGVDLATGETLWGPVRVPGPYQGPGAVFAEPAPAMGETGRRVALDPATGDVVLEAGDGRVVVGEYDGVVLVADGATLAAVDAATGGESWRVPLPDLGLPDGDVVAPADSPVPAGVALVAPAAGGVDAAAAVLVDLTSGEALARGVSDVVRDPVLDVWVVLGGGVVRAQRDGATLWSVPVAAEARLAAAGGALVYVREGDAVRALNVLTGAAAVAYEDDGGGHLVPSAVTPSGAAVVRTDRYLLLTTTER